MNGTLSKIRGRGPAADSQKGVALFVVLIFVMLSMLLALWASRTSLFNEMVVGNDADYQRAFEAAQALLQDAELDIRGEKSDGTMCIGLPCRSYQSGVLQLPRDPKDINPLLSKLAQEPTRCKDGICTRRVGRVDFWNYEGPDETPIDPPAVLEKGELPLAEMRKSGARYGQYTGAAFEARAGGPLNPILADRREDQGGWYWIEVLRYKDKVMNAIPETSQNELPLNLDIYTVFRITALARGRKEGNQVVLQQTYARQRLRD